MDAGEIILPSAPRRGNRILAAAGAAWIVAILAGFGLLLRYDLSSGNPGNPPRHWPAESALARTEGRKTLVMIAHPKCPCTRASVSELEEIMARCQGQLDVDMLFVSPQGAGDGWAQTTLWKKAAAIPGVRATIDNGGVEAGRFHVATSGHVLLYDEEGLLAFSGGITSSRGHGGDNAGRASIIALVEHRAALARATAVYGCPLVDPAQSVCAETLCAR